MSYRIPKDVLKRIESDEYYSAQRFESDAKRYIEAIEDERMICKIHSVAPSGMSRVMSFMEFGIDKKYNRGQGYVLNFFMLFDVLGYQKVKDSDGYRIHGCGMDMVFNTNYNIIHSLWRMGFLQRKRCNRLAQRTPRCV